MLTKTATRVLIADDDMDYCGLLRCTLEREGYEVFEAHNGKDAMELMDKVDPRLVLLDSMLPNKPGFECLQQIKGSGSHADTCVIMCSGKGDLEYVLKCSEAGADSFIHKPFDLDTLSIRIKRILRS